MTRIDDIAGYTYNAENYTSENLIKVLVSAGLAGPGAVDMNAEDVLDIWAGNLEIDREDEHSFDSSEFPKVIFWDQVDDEYDWEWLEGLNVVDSGRIL